MSLIDLKEPVWIVRGHLPPEDGRRRTVLVNAYDQEEAVRKGKAEGLHTVDAAKYIAPEQIREWERLAPKPKAVTTGREQVTKCNPTPDGGCDGDANCMHAPTRKP